jgi:hypothetical protein
MPLSAGTDFGTLVSRLQATTSVTSAEAQARINQMYRRMVADSHWLTEKITLGPIVAGTNHYALPVNVVQLLNVRVNGYAYDRKSADEIDDLGISDAWVRGRYRGFYSPEWTSAGVGEILIWPTPTTVVPFTARVAIVPEPMTNLTAAGEYPLLPVDFHEDLVDGALATVFRRDDERLGEADQLEARFVGRIHDLRGRKKSRVGGGIARVKLLR